MYVLTDGYSMSDTSAYIGAFELNVYFSHVSPFVTHP